MEWPGQVITAGTTVIVAGLTWLGAAMRSSKQQHDELRSEFADYKVHAAANYVGREEMSSLRREIRDELKESQLRTEKCLDKIGNELSEIRKRMDVIIGGKE